jgi:CO/xanthine dehydrogenase FAD-binding subunit
VLLALGGHVVARSARGSRIIPAADFFTGVMETRLAYDELLTEAWFPKSTGKFAIVEETRRHGDFALAGAVRYGDRLALFGVAATPVLADRNNPTKGLQPSGDLEATPEFRLHLVQVLTDRVFAA